MSVEPSTKPADGMVFMGMTNDLTAPRIKFSRSENIVIAFAVFLFAQTVTIRFGVVNKPFDPDPLHAQRGLTFEDSARFPKDCLPIYQFADLRRTGANRENNQEFDYYLERERNHEPIPEILPVDKDTNGNWGNVASVFQLSLRFRQKQFEMGASVPAILVLRNLSESNSPAWVRNALPDHGYKLTIWHDGKTAVWFRRQRPLPTIYESSDFPVTDPMRVTLKAHRGELTAIELNRYFYLNDYGQYTVQAQIEVPMPDGRTMTNLFSGIAEFEIVNK